ncbi:MAG: hypothetical protein QGH15_21650, partial [Kiritimatiellia bacterium]|nr:hypothetical protein [Kiritimatiellia bacterium]
PSERSGLNHCSNLGYQEKKERHWQCRFLTKNNYFGFQHHINGPKIIVTAQKAKGQIGDWMLTASKK